MALIKKHTLHKYRISKMETDFLQAICFFEDESSNKPFVQETYKELAKRGISPLLDELSPEIIKKYENRYSELKNQFLSEDSYSNFELIWMSLTFIQELIYGHTLEGETKKRKQRIYAILGGILFYTFIFVYIIIQSGLDHEKQIEKIKGEMLQDSLLIAEQDWSGIYEFSEPPQMWFLEIYKDKSDHSGVLKLNQGSELVSFECSIVIKDYGIQIFPDTVIESFNIKSITDLLFEFEIEEDDTLTWWYTLKPLNYDSINGTVGFKKN